MLRAGLSRSKHRFPSSLQVQRYGDDLKDFSLGRSFNSILPFHNTTPCSSPIIPRRLSVKRLDHNNMGRGQCNKCNAMIPYAMIRRCGVNSGYSVITVRNYIFFETNRGVIQERINSVLSLFGAKPMNGNRMEQGKKIVIRLRNKTKKHLLYQIENLKKKHPTTIRSRVKRSTKDARLAFASSSRKTYERNKLKFREWRKLKQKKFTASYIHRRTVLKGTTKEFWTTLKLKMASKNEHRIASIKELQNFRDWALYSRHSITIQEPFKKEWFTVEGYPLTSRDPRTARFVNPWNSESTNGWKQLSELWKWKKTRIIGYDLEHCSKEISSTTPILEPKQIPCVSAQFAPPSSSDKIKMTWVGHATMLVQMSSFTILTDPVFSPKASPVQFFSKTEFFGVPRRLPPSFAIDDLPKNGVDVCLLSHDHYDHLDYNSVVQLNEKNLVKYWIVPLGIKDWLIKQAGVDCNRIIELEWWQSVKFKNENGFEYFSDNNLSLEEGIINALDTSLAKDEKRELEKILKLESDLIPNEEQALSNEMVVTCAPAQHWCSRSPFDRNTRLWCSWAVHTTSIMEKDKLGFYFAGDTAKPKTFPLHRQIGDRLGPFDMAAIPIGCYKPRFFMHDSHCDPYESVQIHQDIRSKRSVAIHWGTFPLANEAFDEPPQVLSDAVRRAEQKKDSEGKGHGLTDFIAIRHGESIESSSIPCDKK